MLKKMIFAMGACCFCLFYAACVTKQDPAAMEGAEPDMEFLTSAEFEQRPFSKAVRVGDLLFLSGILGLDPATNTLPEGIQQQTRQAMEIMKSTVEEYGSSMDHVAKVTVMMADMELWGDMNDVYVTYFKKDHLPARSAFGASGLAMGGLLEIECVAVIK